MKNALLSKIKFGYKEINWQAVVALLISMYLLLLMISDSKIQWNQLAMSNENFAFFISSIIVFILSVWIQGYRARILWFNIIANNRIIGTYNSLLLGNFYNCLLPGNIGGGIRALDFAKNNNISFLKSTAGIIAEKWLDTQITIVLILPFLSYLFFQNTVYYMLLIFIYIAFVLSIFYVFLIYNPALPKIILRLFILPAKIIKIILKLYLYTSQQLNIIYSSHRIFDFSLLAFVMFLLNVLQSYLILRAAVMPFPICSFYSAYFISLCILFISSAPSAPNNAGTIHYGIYNAMILLAKVYNIKTDTHLLQCFAKTSIYIHLSIAIPEIILGMAVLLRKKKWI